MKKRALILIALALLIIFNFTLAVSVFRRVSTALSPIFIGIIVALTLDIPMRFLEERLLRKLRPKKARSVAVFSVVILSLGLLAGIVVLLLPDLTKSARKLTEAIPEFLARTDIKLFGKDLASVAKEALDKGASQIMQKTPQILSALSVTADVIFRVGTGIFLGVFMLSAKEDLCALATRIGHKILPEKAYGRCQLFCAVAKNKFGAYLAGQLLEGLIFGTAVALTFTVLGFPYALLIGVIMGIANLIPMLGAYAGTTLVFIILFTVDPVKALWFIPIILALQQIEQVTTYPAIVGRNVRLSPFWVLASVTVGGLLFGFAGVFLSVPFTATVLAIEKRNDMTAGLTVQEPKRETQRE